MKFDRRADISTRPIMGIVFGLLPPLSVLLCFLSQGYFSLAWVVLAFLLAAPATVVLGITGLRHANETVRQRVEKALSWVSIGLGVAAIAVAICFVPSFFRARAIAQLNACIGNMCQLDSAKEQYAMAHGLQDGDEAPSDGVAQYIKGSVWANFRCPTARENTYTLERIGVEPRCAVHGTMKDYHLPGGKKSWEKKRDLTRE